MKKYLLSLIPFALCAHPQGEQVKHGECDFSRDSSTLTITQKTDKAIVHWDDFSIAKGETTRFVQPKKSSSVLNRVVSDKPSSLYGNLESNGRVYLINQNGIVIGPEGQIRSAGFIASTLHLSDDHFLQGKDHFIGAGSIKNEGKISCEGDVFLIARNIEDRGQVFSSSGAVKYLAGSEVLLQRAGDKTIVSVSGEGFIDQKGLIEAVEIQLKANGKDISQLAINQEGIIRAKGIEEKDGQIFLSGDTGIVAVKGDLKADTVHVLGEYVQLLEHAKIDVSGEAKGGTVLIGGDYKGQNPDIPNAHALFVGPGVVVDASCTGDGPGGKIIFWGENLNWFYGTALALNKGFVEISSHGSLRPEGHVDTGGGTLLLDPIDINIGAVEASVSCPDPADMTCTDIMMPCTVNPIYYKFSAAGATISTSRLAAFLECSDVIIDATQAGAGFGVVDFQAPDPLMWTAATHLHVMATGKIAISKTITNTNAGPTFDCLTIETTGTSAYLVGNYVGIEVNGAISTMSGNISMTGVGGPGTSPGGDGVCNGILFDPAASISSAAGSITLMGTTGSMSTFNNGIVVGANLISSTDGTITLTGNGLNIIGGFGSNGTFLSGSNVNTTGSGSIFINGTGTAEGIETVGNIIQTTGTGSITMMATGGAAPMGTTTGLTLTGATITTTSTPVNITAIAGSGGSAIVAFGGTTVNIGGGPSLIMGTGSNLLGTSGTTATITNNSADTVTFNGVGGFAGLSIGVAGSGCANTSTGTFNVIGSGTLGINLVTGSLSNTSSGTLNVTGNGTMTGIVLQSIIGGVASSGPVTVATNSFMFMGGTVSSGAAGGTVFVESLAAGNSIGLGTSPGSLTIPAANIAAFTADTSVTFGRADQAVINVGGATFAGAPSTIIRADTVNVQANVDNAIPNTVNYQIGLTGAGLLNLDSTLSGTGTKNASGIGPATTNTISAGLNTTNSWNITGIDSGNLVTSTPFTLNYNNIGNLIGGTMPDTFVVATAGFITGGIDGVSAMNNSLDYSTYVPGPAVTVDLQAGTASRIASFANIQDFKGNPASPTSFTLIGPNTVNMWNITSLDTGSVNPTFSNFGNLIGGNMADTFIFADGQGISGYLDGGAPATTNILDYTAFTVPATVTFLTATSGTASNIAGGFSNICCSCIIGNAIVTCFSPPTPPVTPGTAPIFMTQIALSLSYFFADPTRDDLFSWVQLYLLENAIKRGNLFLDDIYANILYPQDRSGLNPQPQTNYTILNNPFIPSGLFGFFPPPK